MNLQIGLMNDEAKLVSLGTWMALFVVFTGRKFTQPIKVQLLFTKNSNIQALKRCVKKKNTSFKKRSC